MTSPSTIFSQGWFPSPIRNAGVRVKRRAENWQNSSNGSLSVNRLCGWKGFWLMPTNYHWIYTGQARGKLEEK